MIINRLYQVAIFVWFGSSAYAVIPATKTHFAVGEPLAIGDTFQRAEEIQERFKQIKASSRSAVRYIECAEYEEIENALICMGPTTHAVNLAFARASIWADGFRDGVGRRRLVTNLSNARVDSVMKISGHNLSKKHLILFYKFIQMACDNNPSYCLDETEKAVFDYLIPYLNAKDDFAVIAMGLDGKMDFKTVLSHEFHHLQYALDKDFRSAIDEFWDNVVEEKDKKKLTDSLKTFYSVVDSYLVKNEFQAYLLMSQNKPHRLSDIAARYRNLLRARLLDLGLKLHFYVELNTRF